MKFSEHACEYTLTPDMLLELHLLRKEAGVYTNDEPEVYGPQRTIPTIQNVPFKTRLVVQDHMASRHHWDLRIVAPDGSGAFSWAIPKARFPEPGEMLLAVQTPVHRVEYLDFEGVISKGRLYPHADPRQFSIKELRFGKDRHYGDGIVKKVLDTTIDVVQMDPDHVRFIMRKDGRLHEYLLKRRGAKTWFFRDVTPRFGATVKPNELGITKIPDKTQAWKKGDLGLQVRDPSWAALPKIDGIGVVIILEPGRYPKIIQARPDRQSGLMTNHTYRFNFVGPTWDKKRTVVRGELFAVDKRNKALAFNEIVSLFNVSPSDTFMKSAVLHVQPSLALFDITRYDGKLVLNKPYSERLKLLQEVRRYLQKIGVKVSDLPVAVEPQEIFTLWRNIESGRDKLTQEGIVFWPLDDPHKRPFKIKVKKDYDVYVCEIFEGRGRLKGMAGGFTFSFYPDCSLIAGKVGSGFSDALRKDMWQNKDKYIGLVARVTGIPQGFDFAGNPLTLRHPTFLGWHPDKNGFRLADIVQK